ncbi:MAG TPA: hypothetical protein VEL74_13070, partial [Thermoanaerobaculia bacterium]|nr:hypothetical protein [Thermoanaerobaculia bacterium]
MKTLQSFLATVTALLAVSLPLAAAEAPAETPQPELPRGQLIEKVTAQEAPDQTYALYLPSSYRPDRTWPVLYAMEARGQGADFARRFTGAAEKLGVIVASSYNTASDGAMQPNLTAMRAMWADTHRRLSIDDKRVYAAGFSGTVRAACLLASLSPGSIVGVIGASGGFPFDRPPSKDTPFVFFGTVGDRDFNYDELMDLEADLSKAGIAYRIELFEGGHEWPPADLAGEGLAWLELQSAKAGRRVQDSDLLDGVWKQGMERARAHESGGRLPEAFRGYQALAADFRGLPPRPELTELRAKIEAMERSEALAT